MANFNLSEFSRQELRSLLADAAKKLAFVKDTVKNVPEVHIPFNRLNEMKFFESRISEYRGELARRKAKALPARAFYSYSRKDKHLLSELDCSLSALKAEGVIEIFWDINIDPGSDWHTETDEELNDADIILMLVSPDFLESKYCQRVEIPIALDLYNCGLVKLIPILLRACEWRASSIARFQMIPRDCRPITEWSNQADAWAEVVNSIRTIAEQVRQDGE